MTKRSATQPLEKWLIEQVKREDAGALEPLPATRALGERFHVSHGTAFRLLTRMEKEGQVWRHANGRFYPALAGRVLGRAKPLAVMLRRMQAWSSLCREVMEGFTDECGERDLPILWFHNKDLVNQPTPEGHAQLAPERAQKEMLREFFLLHGDGIGGVLFDEVWRDGAIDGIFPAGLPLVSFARPSLLPGVGSVIADFRAGALLAVSHLLACGYEKIYFIDPLSGYETAAAFLQAGREIFQEISGKVLPAAQIVKLHNLAQRRDFLRRLSESKTRGGIICPEDNLSLLLADEMKAGGLLRNARHGLVSAMGTSALPAGTISCIRYDYRAIGRKAASMLNGGGLKTELTPPELDPGTTTSRS